MLFALAAALIWLVGEGASRVEAQAHGPDDQPVAASPDSTANTGSAPSPIVVASGAQFANVRGLATDAAGGLYISLSATPPAKNCVASSLSSPSGSAKQALTIFSNCTLAPSEDPSGIAIAPHNNIFLANRAQNTIRLLSMLTGKVAALPVAPKTSAARAASSNLDPFEPAGLSSDAQGNLYIADRGNNRILGLAPNAAHFTYVAHVLDAAAVAVDSKAQKLYVAAPAANRVFVIDLNTGAINEFAGSGASADTSSGDPKANFASAPDNAQLGAPEGVAVDAKGNVFISDTGANAIVRVDAKSGTLSRVALNETLNSPGALAIDRSGDVFVADRGHQRIVEFPQMAAGAPAASVTISPSSFDFGDEPTGGSTPAQLFTLTNNSSSALSLSNADITFTGANAADYTETNNCAPSLGALASCQINVTFTPAHTGGSLATLEVTGSDGSSAPPATLSGTGDDFELTVPNVTDATVNVVPGNSATYTISVAPDSVFSGSVSLQCPAVLSAKTTTIGCTIQPSSVAVTPSTPQQFTVTLTTGGPNATEMLLFVRRIWPGGRVRLLLLCVFALMLTLFYFRAARRAADAQLSATNTRTRPRLAAIFFALLAATAAVGCGGYSSHYNPNETPVGSYPIVITGTAQNAGRSITLTLNVD
ncbi:MAG TPA: choice-of-anchor D domain-containing protein [Candidatus Acidoferrales bacterium]|nr:choice-of-anchor D domain-containing protein [Candidatus Acidoferrales bacterium]